MPALCLVAAGLVTVAPAKPTRASGPDAQGLSAQQSDLPPEILSLAGDAEYGEFLSQGCSSCHQRDGGNDGIPPIIGWPTDSFVAVMHAYRAGDRAHPVMQMIARGLDNEQIAALAAYYETLAD